MWLQKRLLHLKIDPAVFWGGLARACLFVATPLSVLFIGKYFTPELQGYYYTFSALLSLQVFGELGLGQVLVTFSSHEWSKLKLDESGSVIGDPNNLSRLVSLGRLAFKWFGIVGPIFSLGLWSVGFFFFSQKGMSDISWVTPWLVLCILTGISFFLIPVWSLLNGCHQVVPVSFFRFLDSLFFNIALLVGISHGLALWTPVLATGVRIAWSGIFLSYKYTNFLKTFFSIQNVSNIHWKHDIWPIQWRSAVCWISGYFAASVITPVMFHFHGAVLAGKTGMTLLLFEAVSSISMIWLTPKMPRFGTLIANKQYQELDQFFWRITKIIAFVSVTSASIIWLAFYLFQYANYPLSTRFLSPLPTGLFLMAQVLNMATSPMSVYLRAHKREPLMAISVVHGILSVSLILVLGKYFAAVGIAMSCLLVNIIIMPCIAIIWYRCRKIWHAE